VAESTIRFTDAAGAAHEFQATNLVGGEGQTVEVTYDPQDPTVARVTGHMGKTHWLWVFVVGSFLVGSLVLVFGD